MKPIPFKEQTTVVAKNQKEYQPLPAHITENGTVVSCWNLSLRERVRVLFTGKIWMGLLMWGEPTTPSLLATKKEEIFVVK